jgi:hypothetical protein
MAGQQVRGGVLNGLRTQVDISDIPPAIYILQLNDVQNTAPFILVIAR